MKFAVFFFATVVACAVTQGLKAKETEENKSKKSLESEFENAKEREEFFRNLDRTHMPLEKTGLPLAAGDSVSNEDKEFYEDEILNNAIQEIEEVHDKTEDEDDVDELRRSGVKSDARPAWPCRRRRWWGSCSVRRRHVSAAIKKVFKRFKSFGRRVFSRRRRGGRRRS